MRLAYSLFIALIVLQSSRCRSAVLDAPQASVKREDIPKERVGELLVWISKNSSYNTDFPPPKFIFVPIDELQRLYYGNQRSTRQGFIYALYGKGTIWLDTLFSSPRDDWILVHELVHYIQDKNGVVFKCSAEAERDAHVIQAKFVDELGIGKKATPKLLNSLKC